jgi:hypothetical protein
LTATLVKKEGNLDVKKGNWQSKKNAADERKIQRAAIFYIVHAAVLPDGLRGFFLVFSIKKNIHMEGRWMEPAL